MLAVEVRLQLLGRFQVRRGGEEVPPAAFGGRKVRTLLRVLAVRRPDLVPHDALADVLWPDRLPADPATNLGVLVNRARRALGDPATIITGSGGYALGSCAVDIDEFQAALEGARAAAQPATAARACAAALAMWGEPLPEDTYADWARATRERLRRARAEVGARAARAALELGDPRAAVAHAADAVAGDPLDESAVLVLAEALAAAGDPAGALARIAELRALLADQLGVDPSAEVERLQLALLRGEVRPARRIAAPAPAAPRPFGELAFVGRDDELGSLRSAVAAGRVVLLSGVAGAGKSRLVGELARTSPLPVLAARAFLPEQAEAWGLARSVLREVLAMDAAVADALPVHARDALTVLLPELGGAPASALDAESRRALLHAGGLRLLEGAVADGVLLVVDDLQWADPSSLALIGSALARLPRLAAVLAYRPEELSQDTLDGLRGARTVVEIGLGPLSPAAVTSLVDDPELAGAVLAATDGTPFAVAEVLRELAARGALAAALDGRWTARQPSAAEQAGALGRAGQRQAIRRRAARQSGLRAEVLALLALLAREAAARTVAAASGAEARAVLEALSALAAAGLVRLGEQGWATAHDLVAETVTAGLGGGERGRLHGLLARALEAEDADPSETARHHRAAGDLAAAARAWLRAAEQALAAQATSEAVELASAGLGLALAPALRADLLAARAEALAAHGDPAAAAGDLRAALAVTGRGPLHSRRLSRLAMLTFGSRDVGQASELAELALVEAGEDTSAMAAALETAAIVDMNSDRGERARERAEAALAAYRTLGDAAGVARILDGRAMATFLEGHITEAVATFGRVAQLFADSGELLRVVTPRATRGHGLVFADQAAAGLDETSAAVRLARELDTAEGQAYALWHRSEALSALGRPDEAEADAREAMRLAADHRGWTATAYRALGIALVARGELDDAAAAFSTSAEVAGDSFTLFASWAAARRALVGVARGETKGMAELVAHALAVGPPLGHYEARWADVELLAFHGDPLAVSRAAAACDQARAGGHLASVRRLTKLSVAQGMLEA
jgi:DNA-binding SARP family transcriptional activator